jgi:protein-disulfide isomerase
VNKFKADMESEHAKARVEADRLRGESLGIQTTPTLFINNQPLEQKDKNPEGIRAVINAALEKKPQA